MSKNSIRIPPFYFIHILDRNSNITRLEIGPQTFIVQDHEMVATGEKPVKMIVLQPNTYCEITNPVIRNAKGELSTDKFGQVNLRYGETEYRFYQTYPEPFPLYPRESLSLVPTKLRIVKELSALKIEASRNFKSPSGIERKVGDVWLFEGPNTYIPRIEERIVDEIRAQIIGESQALKLRALETFTDRKGIKRKAGEEWLIREPGSYLAGVYEVIVELQNPFILTDGQAIHLKAVQNFTDAYKKERKAGEEWLVTLKEASFHVLDIFEEFVGLVKLTILRSAQFCVVLNPYDPVTGKNHYGTQEQRKGTCSFFLQPGESLDGGVKDIYILQEDEALLLHALEAVDDKKPGDRWMVHGPGRYVPPVKVEVLDKRKVIPLDKNEGIYVKDIRTGKVRMEIGQSYMLKAHEELFVMELDELTEKILAKDRTEKGERIKYKVVSNRVPYNAAVQIYNFKKKTTNVVFGPNLVMLGPDEQFTVSVFSGGFPKRPGVLKKINVDLGPVFSTDLVVVETSDHATLK